MPSRSIVSRDDPETLRLELQQRRRRDRLDLRDDQCRFLAQHEFAQRRRIQHVEHVRAMRHLHRRCVPVAIRGDHLDAESLQFDRDFLAEFASAEHEHARAGGRERGADGSHSEGGRG
jgi:hypothetical protein